MQVKFLSIPEPVKEQYFIADGFPNNELILIGNLMSGTGVYSIQSKEDIKLLAYRSFLLYEIFFLWDNLFLNEVFFFAHLSETPYNNEKLIDFALASMNDGVKYSISTHELSNFIGLKILKKSNLTDKIFVSEKIKNCKPFWQLKNGHVLFPGGPRNYRLRRRILAGKKPLKKTLSNAEKWANEVVKFLEF